MSFEKDDEKRYNGEVKLTNKQYFGRMVLMSFEFEVVSNVG